MLISHKAYVTTYLYLMNLSDLQNQVSRLSDKWRTATNSKRTQNGGGFGGISSLEKKRQFRAADPKGDDERKKHHGYGMVFDKDAVRDAQDRPDLEKEQFQHARSRSPRRDEQRRSRAHSRDERRSRYRSRDYRRDDYDDRRRLR